MLLTLSTTHQPTSDLGFLLHKHPAKVQQFELTKGFATVLYPEVSEAKITAAMLMQLDPIALVRGNENAGGKSDFLLEQYVNDRMYVSSSFASNAIAKVFTSALNGICTNRPELLSVKMPFEIKISVASVRGGARIINTLFEPLGYEIEAERLVLDERFPAWGESHYYNLTLRNTLLIKDLLSHLYILLPVMDFDKHYFMGQDEVKKLLEKGENWLPSHPAKEFITRRYLKNAKGMAQAALDILMKEDTPEEAIPNASISPEQHKIKNRLHDIRLETVADTLEKMGVTSVVDLGCGEGRLLKILLEKPQFKCILGMDVSPKTLSYAGRKLNYEYFTQTQKERLSLMHSSLTYQDKRLLGYEAAALVEVIEHLDEPRLSALRQNIFGFLKPKIVVITTPNVEYNVLYENLSAGTMRHKDHRFEWSRAEFQTWANEICTIYNYKVTFENLGEIDENVGAPSQMAVFFSEKLL